MQQTAFQEQRQVLDIPAAKWNTVQGVSAIAWRPCFSRLRTLNVWHTLQQHAQSLWVWRKPDFNYDVQLAYLQ